MSAWLCLLLGYGAMASHALAMAPHQLRLWGTERGPGWNRLFRALGWVLVVGTYVAAGYASGWQVGLVLATAGLAVAGFAVTQVLTWAPRMLGWSTLLPVGGLLASLMAR